MVIQEVAIGCRAEKHHPNCPCLRCKPRNCDDCPKLTTQHEIPESIGKEILRMSHNELLQYSHPESKVCNNNNDKRVSTIFKNMLRNVENGEVITKEMVLAIRKNGLFGQK